MNELPSALDRTAIKVIEGFNPRLPLPGEADPFTEAALADLTESIRLQGVLQPLLVRPHEHGGYALVAGERRYHAAGFAGLREVPVLVLPLTDDQARLAALTENGQRVALPYAQEALMGLRDIARKAQIAVEEVPGLLNRLKNNGDDPFGVADYLRVTFAETVSTWAQRRALVLKLTPNEYAALNERRISVTALRALLKLEQRIERSELLARVLCGELTAEQVAVEVQRVLGHERQFELGKDMQRLRRALPKLSQLSGKQGERARALLQELLSLADQ